MSKRMLRTSLCLALVGLWALGGCDNGEETGTDAGPMPMEDGGPDPMEDGGPDPMEDGGPDVDAHIDEDEPEITRGRLLVSLPGAEVVRVIDLDDNETFDLPYRNPAQIIDQLHASPNGRMVYAINLSRPTFQMIETGVELESHGDHFHVEKIAPRNWYGSDSPGGFHHHLIAPSSVIMNEMAGAGGSQSRRLVAYETGHDDDGTLTTRIYTLLERSVLPGVGTSPVQFSATLDNYPEGGFAAFYQGRIWTTEPNSAGEGGVITRRSMDDATAYAGSIEESFPCTNPGGMVANDYGIIVTCEEGSFAIHGHITPEPSFTAHAIPAPAESVDFDASVLTGLRTVAMRAWDAENGRTARGETRVVARWADEGVAILMPRNIEATGEMRETIPVAIASPVVDYAVALNGEYFFVLTADGNLHRFNLQTGAAAGEPLNIDHADGDSRLAVGSHYVFVTAPDEDEIVPVNIETWTEGTHIELPAAPGAIVVATISPDIYAHDHD